MGKHDPDAKKIHVRFEGDTELTWCGTVVHTPGPFVNPDAKLCNRCLRIGEMKDIAVSMTWEGKLRGEDNPHWRVRGTPPRIDVQVRRGIIVVRDLNDPEEGPRLILGDELFEVLRPLEAQEPASEEGDASGL